MTATELTKADELQIWRGFLATLQPGSYLALYLADSEPVLEHFMRSDMMCELLTSIRGRRDAAIQEANEADGRRKKAVEERDKLEREVRELRRAATRARDEIEEIAKATATLASRAADTHAKVSAHAGHPWRV